MTTQDEIIKYFRGKNYGALIDTPDEEVYKLASQYSLDKYDIELQPYVAPTSIPNNVGNIPVSPYQNNDDSPFSNIDVQPKKIKGLYGLAASIFTDLSLSGLAAEALPNGLDLPGEAFDISPEFFEKSYNESLAGQAYQALYGQEAYDIENYTNDDDLNGWLAEAGQFILGMGNAAELLAFATGTKLGIAGARLGTSKLANASLLGLKNSAIKSGAVQGVQNRALKTAMVETALSTGISLGTLGAAHTATHEAAVQRKTTGEIDYSKVLKAGAKGFGESFLVAAPAGMAAKGYLGSKYAMAKLASDKKTLDFTTQMLKGVPTQIGVEAFGFTVLPSFYNQIGEATGVDVPLIDYSQAPGIMDEGFGRALFQNTVIIGAMAGFGHATRKLKGIDDSHTWALKLLEQTKKDTQKLLSSQQNVKTKLQDADIEINPEMLKLISNKTQEAFASEFEVKNFAKKQKVVNELIEKIERNEKLTEKEITQLSELALPIKLAEAGLWEELKSNPKALRKIIQEVEGRTITDKELGIYELTLQAQLNNTYSVFNQVNEFITGVNPSKSAPGLRAGKETPIPAETLIQKGLFDASGKQIIKTKIVNTAEEKQKFLNQGYEEQVSTQAISTQPGAIATQQVVSGVSKVLQKQGLTIDYSKNINKAKNLVTELQNETFKAAGQTKGSKNSVLINSLKKNMKSVDKISGDTEAVIEYALHKFKDTTNPNYNNDNIKFRKYSKTVSKFVNWLHKNKKKTLKETEYNDLYEYLIGELQLSKKGKIKQATPDDLSAFATFFQYIDKKFMPRGAGREIRDEISFADINEYITERVIQVDTKVLKNVNKNIDILNKELSKVLSGTNLDKANALSTLIKYGIRDQEIARLTKDNIGLSKKEGYYIDFGVGKNVPKIFKDKTFANVIPIPENVAKFLLKIKTSSDTSPIFGKGLKFKNKSLYSHIASSIFGKRPDGAKYEWNNNRTLLRSKGVIEKADKGQMNGYLRHDKTRIEKIYEKLSIDEQLQIYKNLQKELGISDAPAKFQLEAIGKPASAKELAPWLDAQIKNNPGLKLRKLKDADFVGRFYEGVIDVTMGKANKFTFFHENAHRLKAMIDASGNKRLKNVWNQSEKLFDKDRTFINKKGQKEKRDMEEFLADEIAKYGLRRQQGGNIKQKMGSWLNRLWSNIKSVFFGKSSLNKNDVRNILGEKVFKGFAFNTSAKAGSIARFKYETTAEFSKGLKKQFNDSLADKLKPNEKKALEEYIATTSGIENPELFKLGSSGVSEADLILFQQRMRDIPFLEIKSTASLQEKAKLIKNIELNGNKVFTPTQRENIMKLLNFEGKSMWGASVEKLKAYSEIVNTTRMPGQERVSSIAESATSGELSKIMSEMDGLIGDISKKTLPVGAVMRKVGLKDIASKLENHISVELNHVGQFILFEAVGERLLGKGSFRKAKEHLYLMDAERYVERKNLGLLSKSEQKFIDKAFKSDWVISKDGNLVKNEKYNGAKFKNAINTSTKEGQVVEGWVNYTKYVFENFKQALKQNLGEAEYLNWKQENHINWIRDNIYVSRLVTDKFKQTFQIDSRAYDKLIEKQTAPLAEKLAKKKFKTDKPSEEQIGSVWEDAEMYVRRDIVDMLQFNKGKHSTKFLQKRHQKLPEFIEIDGKRIQVYETAYEGTLKKYALGMSKFMANTEIFPDFVQVKGLNFQGQRAAIDKLITANNKWGNWALDRVNSQLGYLRAPGDYHTKASTVMSGAAQILAKTALSFPTSGIKNLILGQTATLSAFRIRDYFAGLAKVMSKEFRDEVKGTGATEIGLRHIQDMKFKTADKVLNKIFWFGGMKPTENANRYMSIAASKVQQDRLVRIISNKNNSAKKIQRAENRLKDFYSLSSNEISLLKKYGLSGVSDMTFKSSYAKAKEGRTMQNIYNKMNSMAHIKTQGASLSFFMPEWADGKFLRPLTLFKRMAYAATTNSINNFKLAYKNNDMVKMGMLMVGPYITGTSLIAIYDHLFDQKPPTENSAAFSHMKYVYMRGEFLGILSDFLKIYEGESAQQTLYPALYNYLQVSGMTLFKLSKGQMNWSQAGTEMLDATFGGYRGYMKLIDARDNKYFVNRKRGDKLWNAFKEEVFPNDDTDGFVGDVRLTRRSPYYKDFKKVFEKGTAEELAKQYIITLYAVASDLYTTGLTTEGTAIKYRTPTEALKEARKQLDAALTRFNPNKGSLIKALKTKDKNVKAKKLRYFLEWNKWLSKDPSKAQEYKKLFNSLEGAYRYKIRKLEEQLSNPELLKDPEVRESVLKSLRGFK